MCGPSRLDESDGTVPAVQKEPRGVSKATARCASPTMAQASRSSVYALLTGNLGDHSLLGVHNFFGDSGTAQGAASSSSFKSVLRSRLLAATARSIVAQERTNSGSVPRHSFPLVAADSELREQKKKGSTRDLRESIRTACAQKIQTTFWQAPMRLEDLPRGLLESASDDPVLAVALPSMESRQHPAPPTPTSVTSTGLSPRDALSSPHKASKLQSTGSESSLSSASESETQEAALSLFELGNASRARQPAQVEIPSRPQPLRPQQQPQPQHVLPHQPQWPFVAPMPQHEFGAWTLMSLHPGPVFYAPQPQVHVYSAEVQQRQPPTPRPSGHERFSIDAILRS